MWCIKAQILKKVSVAFYKWKYTSMHISNSNPHPTVSTPSQKFVSSANKSGNISAALDNAMSLMSRLKTPVKGDHSSANNTSVVEQHGASEETKSTTAAKQQSSASSTTKRVTTKTANTSSTALANNSILSDVMVGLQYSKASSEHLDRYLKETLVNKDTDFDTKRKLLCELCVLLFVAVPDPVSV